MTSAPRLHLPAYDSWLIRSMGLTDLQLGSVRLHRASGQDAVVDSELEESVDVELWPASACGEAIDAYREALVATKSYASTQDADEDIENMSLKDTAALTDVYNAVETTGMLVLVLADKDTAPVVTWRNINACSIPGAACALYMQQRWERKLPGLVVVIDPTKPDADRQRVLTFDTVMGPNANRLKRCLPGRVDVMVRRRLAAAQDVTLVADGHLEELMQRKPMMGQWLATTLKESLGYAVAT